METKRERLIQVLVEEIRIGRFAGCSKLPAERLLSEQMGVTRALLREALLTMEGMGHIAIAGRDGIYITDNGMRNVTHGMNRLSQWPPDMNSDILEIRVILEVPAAEIAAQNRTDADVERMEECLKILAGLDRNDETHYEPGDHWDSMLHETIVRSTRNELLIRIYEGLLSLMKDFTQRYRAMLFNSIPGWPEQAFHEHERIVRAIREQQSGPAGEAMREHLCLAGRLNGLELSNIPRLSTSICCQ